jgi:tripartite ATP-independent transporter DctP family solute receptor
MVLDPGIRRLRDTARRLLREHHTAAVPAILHPQSQLHGTAKTTETKEFNMQMSIRSLLYSLGIPAILLMADASIAADISKRAIKLGYGIPKEHPLGQGVNRFAELVSEKSDGKITVRGYPANTLGPEAQMISATQGGVQEMVIPSSAPVVSVVKEFALFDLPFLFANEKEADAVLDGPVGQELLDKLPEHNLVGLCFWENGFRQVTNSKRPIVKADDIGGLKIRTMQSPVYIDTFNTLGANATPMSFSELYSALEMGAVDAQENPYAIIHASKFEEVQTYLSSTNHAYAPYVVLVSKKLWDGLSGDERKILEDSCAEAREYQRKLMRETNLKIKKELEESGMKLNEIDPKEVAKMKEQLRPVVEKHAKNIGEDLVKRAYAEIETVRQQK